LGGAFEVEWQHRENVPFHCTQHLTNPWYENKKVQISRDCQEVEPTIGEQLVQLWEQVPVQPMPPMVGGNMHGKMNTTETVEVIPGSNGDGGRVIRTEEEFYHGIMYEGEDAPFIPEGFPPMFGAPFSPTYLSAGSGEFMTGPPHFAPPHMFAPQQYPLYTQQGSHGFRPQDFFNMAPQMSGSPQDDMSGMPHPAASCRGGSSLPHLNPL